MIDEKENFYDEVMDELDAKEAVLESNQKAKDDAQDRLAKALHGFYKSKDGKFVFGELFKHWVEGNPTDLTHGTLAYLFGRKAAYYQLMELVKLWETKSLDS